VCGITSRMAPLCEECGSRSVVGRQWFGRRVEECRLCGHLQGDDADVEAVDEIREAADLGVWPELVGLMRELDTIPGVRVDPRLSTAAGHTLPPAIYFAVGAHGLEVLDRLTRTLLLATRRTSTPWEIEATHQGRLLFLLRPRRAGALDPPKDGAPHPLVADLATLREALRRDRNLPWWDLPS
jgi:hypothetical protein